MHLTIQQPMFFTIRSLPIGTRSQIRYGLEWIVAEFSEVIRSFCQNPLKVWPIFCLDSIAPSTHFSLVCSRQNRDRKCFALSREIKKCLNLWGIAHICQP
jgi:hypothetical protein